MISLTGGTLRSVRICEGESTRSCEARFFPLALPLSGHAAARCCGDVCGGWRGDGYDGAGSENLSRLMEVWKVVQEERKAVCVADLFLRGDKKIRNVLRIPDVVGDFFCD